MGRRSLARSLDLWMNGEQVGSWRLGSAGDELAYAESWVSSPNGRPLSLSLPFLPANRAHRGPVVQAWFDNLLPDSPAIRQRLAARFRTASTEAFDLLAEIGRDCVGALQIVPAGQAPDDVRRLQGEPLTDEEVARELALASSPAARFARDEDAGDLRISIAGAQEKTALLREAGRWMRPVGATPTTHILKLPLGLVGNMKLDLQHSVENEWLCGQIIAAYGLPVAACEIASFGRFKALVVERFDRIGAMTGAGQRWLLRLPQEDMCQATATSPALKYEADGGPGIDRILGLLINAENGVQDRRLFFQAQLLFWLLGAPDGHAKNFSIFLRPSGFALTPLYDVMSAYPLLGNGPGRIAPQKIKLAMAVRSRNPHWRMSDIRRRHWHAVAKRHGLEDKVGGWIDGLVQATPGVVQAVNARLPSGFPQHVADAILQGLSDAAARLAAMAGS
jgi:serine/threonine-protein kinase HipA